MRSHGRYDTPYKVAVETCQVASDQLNVIRSHANGRLLATGGANGKTCILGVGDALAEALPQEKGLLLQAMLLRRILPMKTTRA